MTRTFIHHTDPAHGWLAVKLNEIKELGIEDEISTCSYQDGDNVFLEEDSDAPKFAQAYFMKTKQLIDRTYHHIDDHHWIRKFGSYKKEKI
jgi:hypothetical protein